MRFEHQSLLWAGLAAALGLAAFFWWAWRTKRRLLTQFVGTRLLAQLTSGISPARQKARMALLGATVTLAILALARPQWGFEWEEARQRGLDVVVAIDTSRSMLAADIPPNRLTRAKLAAVDLKRLARADRVGLVAFAGSAFLQCPLSFDDEAFRQSVNALDVNIIPLGGSAIAEAIEAARAAFEKKNDNYKVLVLFTDGEDNDGRAIEAAEAAAKDGMRIFTIGVGTANGELLRISDAKNRTDYVRDEQGNVIKSRLNEKLLQDIARASGGFYMLLSGANTMELLYERGLAPLPKTEHTARRIKRFHERYQWLLGLAVVLLCVEMLLPERQRVRRAAAASPPVMKAAALLVALLLPWPAFGSAASALKEYKAGKFKSALREYERLLREKPENARLHYNAGAAAFQAGNYEKAQEYFSAASGVQDTNLQQRALYNLGNAQFRAGEAETDQSEKQKLWQQAYKSYEAALELNSKDADAEFNRELVKKKLEELQQQQQQQNQDQSDDKNKEQEKKDEKQDQPQKQDQQQKQDKGEQNKEQEKQNEQQSQPQQNKEEEQQQQQRQSQQDKQQQQEQQGQQQQKTDSQEEGKEAAQTGRQQMMQMTPQQAQRLLEAAKGDEKIMIFTPQTRTNRSNRILKDW